MAENRGGLAVYITSHGFGHLNRTVAVVNLVPAEVPVVIRGHGSLFRHWRERLTRPARLEEHLSDSGAVNPHGDSSATDGPATIRRAREVHAEAIVRLDAESARLRREGTAAVLCDAPPIPVAAAARVGIPAYVLSNFTWSEIYREHASRLGVEAERFVAELDELYRHATAVFRAEPALPMRVFRRQIAVGLVGSPGRDRRPELMERLALALGAKLVYLYVGRYGQSDLDWARLADHRDAHFITFHAAPIGPIENLHVVSADEWTGADLQASTDASLAKAGYGSVCEAMLAGGPLVYPPRSGFAEHAVLELALDEWGGGVALTEEAFRRLEIGAALERAFAMRPGPPPFPRDGAATVARYLAEICRRAQGTVQR